MRLFRHDRRCVSYSYTHYGGSQRVTVNVVNALFESSGYISVVGGGRSCSGRRLVRLFLRRINANLPVLAQGGSSVLALKYRLSSERVSLLMRLIRDRSVFSFTSGDSIHDRLYHLFGYSLSTSVHMGGMHGMTMLFSTVTRCRLVGGG